MLTGKELRGAIVAIVTPFRDGEIDWTALESLLDFQLSNGTRGIVVCGTTGESPTLTPTETVSLFRFVVERVKGQVPVIAGSGGNDTRHAIEKTQAARQAGCDATLSVVPYYNRPSQRGLHAHFTAIARDGGLPVILYNVPGRTVAALQPATTLELTHNTNIIGIKDASGSLEQATAILREAPATFAFLSGEDALTVPLIAIGAHGVIATTSNVAPREMSDLCHAALSGRWEEARSLHQRLAPLFSALFMETNPVPVKTALALLGKCQADVRLPLVTMEEANRDILSEVLRSVQILKR